MLDPARDVPPVEQSRSSAQILDPAVGATADKDMLDRHVGQFLPRGQPHIVERLLRRRPLGRILETVGVRHHARHRNNIFRAGAPGDGRHDVGGVDHHRLVEHSPFIGRQRAPPGDGSIPVSPLGRHRAAFQIGESRFVRREQARPCACLDRHIGDGQPPLDRHIAEHRAAIFHDIAGAASGADMAANRQRDILGGYAKAQFAFDHDLHRLRLLEQQCLRRQHMLDLRRANAEGQCAQRAMR